MKEPYSDETIMPYGEHKGKRLIDVPDDYLLFIHNNSIFKKDFKLHNYISDNLDSINMDKEEEDMYGF